MNKLMSLVGVVFSLGLFAACSYEADVEVLGNVYDSNGQPMVGLSAEFCYEITFVDGTDSECTPIATDGHGQFSTSMFSRGNHGGAYQGNHFWLKTANGVMNSGQMISDHTKTYEASFSGNIVINFSVL